MDLTRAFIVLAHAEIEAFCEDLTDQRAAAAKAAFHSSQVVSPVLRKILAYFVGKHGKSWSGVLNPTADIVDSALQSYRQTILKNHGVKQENLEKLLYPLGIMEPELNTTWMAAMSSFGSNRGQRAHQSIRTTQAPDPKTEASNVQFLVTGLLDLDRLVRRLR